MAQKLTEQHYYELAKARGFKWLGTALTTTMTRTLWYCANGHEFLSTYGKIRSGRGCPYCAATLPKAESDYHKVALARGYQWIGDMPQRTIYKTTWICSQGHTFTSSYNNIQAGKGCLYCRNIKIGNLKRLKPEKYIVLANKFNLQLLSEPPTRNDLKAQWECDKGHEFFSTYSDLNNSKGCPICVVANRGKQFRHTIEHYHAIANETGYIWVGSLPDSVNHKTQWICSKGHTFEMHYAALKTGQHCPVCKPERLRKQFQFQSDDYHNVAQTRNFQWVGLSLPNNTATRTEWVCDQGHRFYAPYNGIKRGNGCPDCSNFVNGKLVSKPQIALHEMIGGVVNYKVGRYYIDVALDPETLFRVAVEYDCWYWHEGNEEKETTRNEYLLSLGWRILRIKTNITMPTLSELQNAIERLRAGETYLEIILPDWGK